MSLTIETILFASAGLLLISVLASTASRLGVPTLILFMVIGMLAGSEGFGGIYFDNAWLTQAVGVVALAYILFSGGLDTDWRLIRPVLWQGLTLANLGVVVSTALVGAFAVAVLGFGWIEGLLLGAILSSTDAAAVFAVMRERGVNLEGSLEPLIELESGSNDPIAVFLTAGLTGLLVDPSSSLLGLLPSFAVQMALGTLGGYLMGRLMTLIINRVHLQQDGLYPVLTLTLVLLTYSGVAFIGGNGFLAVYIAGIVLGNSNFIHKRSLLRFHDGIAWLMQIAMFLTLGLLVFPSQLLTVIGPGLLLAGFLMFVARPLSVFSALFFARLSASAKLMISWAGLRGAVPIVLATYPLIADLPKATLLFNLVFFAVLASVLLQGTSIRRVAEWLGVQAKTPHAFHYPLEYVPDISLESRLVELTVPKDSPLVGRTIMGLGLPNGALVVLLRRGNESIIPSGGTLLKADDRLLLLANVAALSQIQTLLAAIRFEPLSAESAALNVEEHKP